MDASADRHLAANSAVDSAKARTATDTRGRLTSGGRGLPGFEAHRAGLNEGPPGQRVPGFAAQSNRDFSHEVTGAPPAAGTGISSTPVRGTGARNPWDCGHADTGSRGTFKGPDTGIPG